MELSPMTRSLARAQDGAGLTGAGENHASTPVMPKDEPKISCQSYEEPLTSLSIPATIVLFIFTIVTIIWSISSHMQRALPVNALIALWVLFGFFQASGYVFVMVLPSFYKAIFLRRSLRGASVAAPTHPYFDEGNPLHPDENAIFRHGKFPADHEHASGSNEDGPTGLYEALVQDHIRLLRFASQDSSAEELALEMISMPLYQVSQTYTALSYCWGTGPASRGIWINGQKIQIRPNLHAALLAMREKGRNLLWIDALCINQGDNAERGAQVLRMRSIFAEAELVVAWLDDPNDETIDQNSSKPGIEGSPSPIDSDQSRLLETAYWSRMWIVQELSVATALEIHYMNYTVDVEELAERVLHPRQAEYSAAFGVPGAVGAKSRARIMLDIRRSWQATDDSSFVDLLYETRQLQCSKRLDRVFALLSLASDGRHFLTEANYELTEAHLSLRMSQRYCFQPKPNLDAFLHAAYSGYRSAALPSWCPNYFRFDQWPSTWESARTSNPDLCDATNKEHGRVSVTGNVLQSAAKHLGTVQTLGYVSSDCPGDAAFPSATSSMSQEKLSPSKVLEALLELLRTPGALKVPSKSASKYHSLVSTEELETGSWCYLGKKKWKKFTWEPQGLARDRDIPPHDRSLYAYASLHVFAVDDAQLAVTDTPLPWFTRWIRANRDFVIGGQTLRSHAKRDSSFHSALRASGGFYFHHRCTCNRTSRDWRALLAPLRALARSNRRLMTIKGLELEDVIGITAIDARIGDEVFLLPGCRAPILLRKVGETDKYTLVGDAIIPGVMDGEMIKKKEIPGLPKVDII